MEEEEEMWRWNEMAEVQIKDKATKTEACEQGHELTRRHGTLMQKDHCFPIGLNSCLTMLRGHHA